MKKVEYRVRPVVRYIVTRYHATEHGEGVETKGEFPNFRTAHAVGYALCKHEHDLAGTPPGDETFIYPDYVPQTLEGVSMNE